MKKQILVIWMGVIVFLLGAGGIAAQDAKKMDNDKMKKDMMTDMAAMKKSPPHMIMMAYQKNVLTFAATLRDMTTGGRLEDVQLARNAFAEIKRSVENMDDIHKTQMSKMSAEKRKMMKPMMEKMQAENALMKEHILALEKALQASPPVATDVNAHAAALVLQLEKMKKSDKKMKM